MNNIEFIDKEKDLILKENKIDELTKSIALLPDFIVEPLKKHIREEVVNQFTREIDFLVEKKLDPYYKKQSLHHIILMALLLLNVIILFLIKII